MGAVTAGAWPGRAARGLAWQDFRLMGGLPVTVRKTGAADCPPLGQLPKPMAARGRKGAQGAMSGPGAEVHRPRDDVLDLFRRLAEMDIGEAG